MVGWTGPYEDGGSLEPFPPRGGRRGSVASGWAVPPRSRIRPVVSRWRRRRMRRTRIRLRDAGPGPESSEDAASPRGGNTPGGDGPTAQIGRHQGDRLDVEGNIEGGMPMEGSEPSSAAKAAGLIAATGLATLAIACFGAELAASAVFAVPFAAMAVLGTAGGVRLLASSTVFRGELGSARVPALRRMFEDRKCLARDFNAAMELLRLEKEGLELEVESIQNSYESLEKRVKDTNAGSMDKLLPLIHENQYVLGQMKEYLKERFLQDAAKMAPHSDSRVTRKNNTVQTCIVRNASPFTRYVFKIAVNSIKLYAVNIAVMKAITQLPFLPFFFAFSFLAILQVSALASSDDGAETEGSNDRSPAKSS